MLKEFINIIFEHSDIVLLVIIGIIFIVITAFIYRHLKWSLLNNKKSLVDSNKPLTIDILNEEIKPYGFAYDLKHDTFFSIMYPWQRNYGYCKAYDEASALLSIIIDCEPIYFEYNNKFWLIEFWKGQYGMTTGGEIGIYSKNKEEAKHLPYEEICYESITDEECLSLSYTLRKKGNKLISRNAKHWWLTGFKLGEFSKPSQLLMDIKIVFTDEKMRDAFIEGLKIVGYKENEIGIIDNSIYLTFNKPHTKQPITKVVKYIMQIYNRQNCKLYNELTKNYNNTLDKLNYIKEKLPFFYRQIINLGKSEQLFKSGVVK